MSDNLTVEQFTRELQICRATARIWRQEGFGPAYFYVGRGTQRPRIRYRRADVDAWIAQRAAETTS